MKIAFLLPSLNNTGPVIVAKDIINSIIKSQIKDFEFKVFYFDEKKELSFNCEIERIDSRKKNFFEDFDIVHSHGYRADKYLFKHGKSIKAKKISTIHCNIFEDLKHSYNSIISNIFGRLWLHYLSKMDMLVTLTNYHQDFYSSILKIDPKKTRVVYNGREIIENEVEKEDLKFFQELRSNYPQHTIIGSFAGLSSIKGLDQLIKALPLLEDHLFVVVGEGKEKKKLIALAKKLKVSHRCFFIGYRKEASRYFKFIDIFALPSHSEAFPLALIEATLQGVSSVCSNIPVLTEVFNEEEVSFFQLNDTLSLIEAIKKASNQKIELQRKCKEKASNKYTANKMALGYGILYNVLANE